MISMFRRLHAIPRTLSQPNFGIYTLGNSLSLIGNWMQRIGVGWLAWELSHSATVLGIIAFADLFPTLVFGPFGGALADRLDRRRVLLVGQTIIMALSIILFGMTVSGWINVPALTVIVALIGVVAGFNQPARLALVSVLVPRTHLPTAVAINSLSFNLARFLGPALAGLVIVQSDVSIVFLLNGLSFLIFIAALWRLRLPPGGRAVEGASHSMLKEVAEGIRYTASHPGIGPLLLLNALLSVTVRPFVDLLPGLADGIFQQGAAGLAILSSAVGVGALISGVWLAQREALQGLVDLSLLGGLLNAIAVLGLALSPSFSMAVVAVTIAGMAMVIGGVGTQTLLQTCVDETVRGRVLSLFGLIFRGAPAVGSLVMGMAADLAGLRLPLVVGAILGLVAWVWIWQGRSRINAAMARSPGTGRVEAM